MVVLRSSMSVCGVGITRLDIWLAKRILELRGNRYYQLIRIVCGAAAQALNGDPVYWPGEEPRSLISVLATQPPDSFQDPVDRCIPQSPLGFTTN